MTSKWLMGTALAAIMSAGAFAQDAASECRIDLAGDQDMSATERFQALDENNDGRISREEYLACPTNAGIELSEADRETFIASFREMDANEDTFLDSGEVERVTASASEAVPTEVEVREQSARVEVQEAEPTVRVEQAKPTVRVEQSEPRVTVEERAPEVRVEQPEPEVRVTQPEPEVAIEQAEPEVRIEQPQAQVQIEQPEPEVRVRQAEPQVQVEVREPRVTVEQPEARVQVQKAEPTVEIRQAEPEIVVEQAEAEVIIEKVTDVDPDVERRRPQQAEEQAAATEAQEAPAETEQQSMATHTEQAPVETEQQAPAQATQTEEAEQPEQTAATADAEQPEAADTRVAAVEPEEAAEPEAERSTGPISYDELIGESVYNLNGEKLGSIEDIVLDRRTEEPVVVLAIGGFLGIGKAEVAVSYDDLTFQDDDRIVLQSDMTEDQLKESASYDAALYEELPDRQR